MRSYNITIHPTNVKKGMVVNNHYTWARDHFGESDRNRWESRYFGENNRYHLAEPDPQYCFRDISDAYWFWLVCC